MDIEYLLWLQNFREASGNFLTPFMQWVSDFSMNGMLLIPIFVYWCLSKRAGLFLMLSLAVSNVLNILVKMTCCVYRPFIRDPRVIPIGHRPSGYSFPSSHAMTVTPICGGLAILSRKKAVWFSCLCCVMILVVMFSRNYLGVHTPQDVVVGMILSLIVLYAVSLIMSHPEHENIFTALGILAVIAGIAYVALKSYPEDYGSNGKLLVNYKNKIEDIYFYGGNLAGIIAGRLIDRKYIKFRSPGFTVKSLVTSSVGLGIYWFIYFTVRKDCVNFLKPFITKDGGIFVHAFIVMLFVFVLWPCVMKLTEGKK